MLPRSLLARTVGFRVVSYARDRDANLVVVVDQEDESGAVIGVGTLAIPVDELAGLDASIVARIAVRFPAIAVRSASEQALR